MSIFIIFSRSRSVLCMGTSFSGEYLRRKRRKTGPHTEEDTTELKAIELELLSFENHLENETENLFLVQSDTTVIAYINHYGGFAQTS